MNKITTPISILGLCCCRCSNVARAFYKSKAYCQEHNPIQFNHQPNKGSLSFNELERRRKILKGGLNNGR